MGPINATTSFLFFWISKKERTKAKAITQTAARPRSTCSGELFSSLCRRTSHQLVSTMTRLSFGLTLTVILLVSCSLFAFIVPQSPSRTVGTTKLEDGTERCRSHSCRRSGLFVSRTNDPNGDMFPLDEILRETETALEKTQRAIVPANVVDEDVVASGIGGAVLGLILGGTLWLQIPLLATIDAPLAIPLLAALTLGAAGSVGASKDGLIGDFTRSFLGGNTKAVGSSIVLRARDAGDDLLDSAERSIENAVNFVKAFPMTVRDAALNRVSSLPGKIVEAAKAMIKALPQKLAEFASRRMRNLQGDIARLPEHAAEAAKAKMDELADDVKSSPARLLEHVKQAADNVLEEEPLKPVPPKIPPPQIDQSIKAVMGSQKKSKLLSYFQSRRKPE